ncbi:MAG: DUF3261 domain-containing protein [Methylococcales bacterium]|nr:DUF3261 domain-containing protein [Methylococcales bacterium]
MAAPEGPSRRVVQQIKVEWPEHQAALLGVMESDKKHIALAGLSNEGFSLFNLSYDGKTLVMDKSPLLPDSVAPESIIADLQLAFWSLAAIQKGLQGTPWRLEFDDKQRRLYFQDLKMVDVNYVVPDAVWPKSVELVNYRQNYRLHIQTISYEALPE